MDANPVLLSTRQIAVLKHGNAWQAKSGHNAVSTSDCCFQTELCCPVSVPSLCVQAEPGASRLAVYDRAGPSAKPCAAQHRLRGDPPVARRVESEQSALGPSVDSGPCRQRCPAGQAPGHRGIWQVCGCVLPPVPRLVPNKPMLREHLSIFAVSFSLSNNIFPGLKGWLIVGSLLPYTSKMGWRKAPCTSLWQPLSGCPPLHPLLLLSHLQLQAFYR